jgi:hypothetical protein
VIFRPNGEPCYVGKGRGNRWQQHASGARNPNLRHIYTNAGGDLPVIKVREFLSVAEASETEIALIAAIGRKSYGGPLVNLTDGGDGPSGFSHSEAMKRKVGDLSRQSWSDPETKARIIAAQAAGRATKEYQEKRRVISQRLSEDPSFRRKISETIKASYQADPSLRQRISDATRASVSAPEIRAKISAAQKVRAQRPEERARLISMAPKTPSAETRAKMSLANRGMTRSDETRARISAAQKGRKMSPEARAKMRAAAIARVSSPAGRAKMAKYGKLGAEKRWGKPNLDVVGD